jgi:hypothetical protein
MLNGDARARDETNAHGGAKALDLAAEKLQALRTNQLDALTAIIDEFNRRYVVVNEAGKAMVYEQTTDPIMRRRVLIRIGFADLRKLYQNRFLTVTKENGREVKKSVADWWLGHRDRRQYLSGVVFDPTGRVSSEYWNLWSGFSVEPAPGEWSLMRDHVVDVICGGNLAEADYVFRWVARMIQQPDRQGEVALVIRGNKGAGKGIFFQYLRNAWGQHGVYISNAKHLVGNFNAHLRDCIFLFADEAFFAGDRQHEGVLKSLITEPVLTIEGKYQNAVNVANMLHIGMASNSDWVVPASHDERRYAVLNASDHRIGDKVYFNEIGAQMEDGGLAAMIYDMLRLDISDFEVRDFPRTEALVQQKRHSLDSLHCWWLAVLERGFVWKSRFGAPVLVEWQERFSTELLFRSYSQWCQETRPYDRKSREELGVMMAKLYKSIRTREVMPLYELESIDSELCRNGKSLDEVSVVRKERAPGYFVGNLDQARNKFSEVKELIVVQDDDT